MIRRAKMAGYYIRDCRSFGSWKILDTLIKQKYDSCHQHFNEILYDYDISRRNVVLYDGIIRAVYCDDYSLKNYIECVRDLKEIFIPQDKVFLGAV